MIEGFVGKESEAQGDAEPDRRRPSRPAAKSSAPARFRRRDPNAPLNPDARNFNPEEINPPVATKGGMTALLHAARQGYIEAAEALLDGGANINQPTPATAPRRC